MSTVEAMRVAPCIEGNSDKTGVNGMRNAELDEKTVARARNSAYRLLTFRPRSKAELRSKLQEKDFADTVVHVVIDDLARLGYLDDQKFAEQLASSRIRLRGFGRRRIALELRSKGIEQDIIREVISGAFPEGAEAETAQRAAEKKLRTMKSADPYSRRRTLAAFLERRGFPSDVIRRVLSGPLDELD